MEPMRRLAFCSKGHKQVSYLVEECPACVVQKELEARVRHLEVVVAELTERNKHEN